MKQTQSAAGDTEDEPGGSSGLRIRFPGKIKKVAQFIRYGAGQF